MRIHKLSFSSIGPYNQPQEIDFEPLNDAGVFLFSGPTGAGKSTILDALTLALYGGPAVERGSSTSAVVAKNADLVQHPPTVMLEFSTKQHRYRIERILAHTVPSKRANSGYASRNAKVVLERMNPGGEYEVVSSHVQEVGAEMENILHLNRAQFTTVMMLPQGQFATFLTGSSKERGVILERLFGTQRFQTVMTDLKEQAAKASANVSEQLNRIEQLESGILQEAESFLALSMEGPDESFQDQLTRIQLTAAAQHQRLQQDREEIAQLREATLRTARGFEEDLKALEAHQEYDRRHKTLEENTADFTAHQKKLDHDRAAGHLWADHKNAQTSKTTLDAATHTVERLAAQVSQHWGDTSWLGESSQEEDLEQQLEEQLTAVVQAVHAATERKQLETSLIALQKTAKTLDGEAQTLQTEVNTATQRLQDHAQELSALRDRGSDLEQFKEQRKRWHQLPSHREELKQRVEDVATVRQQVETANLETVAARENQLALMRLQLNQAAHRLAQELREGEPCQVCGSLIHPAPAQPESEHHDLVTEENIQQATAEYEQKLAEQQRFSATHVEAQQNLASAQSSLKHVIELLLDDTEKEIVILEEIGSDIETALKDQEQSLNHKIQQATTETARFRELTQLLKATEEEVDTKKTALQNKMLAITQNTTQRTLDEQRIATLTEVVRPWEEDHESVTVAEAHIRAQRELLRELKQARSALETSRSQHTELQRHFDELLAASIFSTVEEFIASRLESENRSELEVMVKNHQSEMDRLSELAESDLYQRGHMLRSQNIDAEKITTQLEQHSSKVQEVNQQLSDTDKRLGQSQAYQESLARSANDWFRLREDHADIVDEVQRIQHVADIAAGNNDKRMPLNIFVLAAKLEHVVEEACKHLLAMSDHRYQLRYNDERIGNQLVGLGLKIYDVHTSVERETKTLSGGETFMASLALALGLADVVQQEAGGTSMETLFIDEGFGSLDTETLDDVMGTIQQLFDYGRVVGLVSHVDDMKRDIPTQLTVVPHITGSTVHITTGS